jgi:CRP/FNR family cyclic AMP-dependent transcriptional regulator
LWSDQFSLGRSILELWEELPSKVDAAIFMIGQDTTGRAEQYPRQDVVFELGLFHGKLGRQRTIILASAGVHLPTDILGTIYLRYEPDPLEMVTRQLRREFKNMGLL